MKDVPVKDLFGIFYVKKIDAFKWESKYELYYKTIDSLRELFGDREFKKVVHGFYLNNIDSVRVSYFVDEKEIEKSMILFQEFFAKNRIQEIRKRETPHTAIVAKNYGGLGYEQRFRNFLRNYTQIGLELLQGNLLHSRRLFTVYRFQVKQKSVPFEEFFEPTFRKYSPSYVSFSDRGKSQFFNDLKTSTPSTTEWAHMMINMIVGCDWNLLPSSPIPIQEINDVLIRDNLGFRIPDAWNPQSFDI
jgi:hypothetical protein